MLTNVRNPITVTHSAANHLCCLHHILHLPTWRGQVINRECERDVTWLVLEMSIWVLIFLSPLVNSSSSVSPFPPPPAYFTELHGRSERSLQEALSPLGPLYSQNTRLYGDLYNDLRQYYRGSAVNLDETLSEFWSRLLERTFKASVPTDVSEDTSSTRGHILNHSLVHSMIKKERRYE